HAGEDEGRLDEAHLARERVDAVQLWAGEIAVTVVARERGAVEGLRVLRGAGVVVEEPGLARGIDRVGRVSVLVVAGAPGALEQERRGGGQPEAHLHRVPGLIEPVAR